MPEPSIQILSSEELLALKAKSSREGVRRDRFAFHRGGSFDLVTLTAPPEVVAVVADPKKLSEEQHKAIADAHPRIAAKLPKSEAATVSQPAAE